MSPLPACVFFCAGVIFFFFFFPERVKENDGVAKKRCDKVAKRVRQWKQPKEGVGEKRLGEHRGNHRETERDKRTRKGAGE